MPTILTWFLVLTVVRKGDHFLLVQENEAGSPWYLPAGRVEPGETLTAAARREVLEEAGIPVVLDGIVKVQHTLTLRRDGVARLRVIFTAHPEDETPPKTTPDEHTLQAGWFTLKQIQELPLRASEVLDIFQAVADGAPIAPLSLLGVEGEAIG
jgi:phosphatase NudJ